MWNNHLTSYLSGFNLYKLLILFLLISCASSRVSEYKKSNVPSLPPGKCLTDPGNNVELKHLITGARIKSSSLAFCFKNYLRFEKEKKQLIGTCNQLSIKRSGRVSYVQVTNVNKKSLPKDFKMCLVQEYWKMSFKGLQLENSYIIKFPLQFSSL